MGGEQLVYLPGVEVEFRPDISIVQADVGVLFNSANGGLLHAGGTAAEISRASGELAREELAEFSWIVSQMPGDLGVVYREFDRAGTLLLPTKLQLESARLLLDNDGMPLSQGQAVLTTSGKIAEEGGAKWVVHAVGMTYDFASRWRDETGRPPLIVATPELVTAAIRQSLLVAQESGLGSSIAIPKMCVGRGGIPTWKESFQAIQAGIRAGIEDGVVLKRVVIIGEEPQ